MPQKIKLPPENNKEGVEKFEEILQRGVREAQKIPSLKDMRKLADASVRELVDGIIRFAYLSRASDVHIDPGETVMTVRYRIDGILYDVLVLPKKALVTSLTRIKVLSEMRTDEHMAAQDGRFRLVFDGLPVDVRVSIIPMSTRVIKNPKIVSKKFLKLTRSSPTPSSAKNTTCLANMLQVLPAVLVRADPVIE